MKFSAIFSIATLAFSAAASPILGDVVNKVGGNAVDAPKVEIGDIENFGDLIENLKITIAKVTEQTSAMNATVAKVQDGEISKDAADGELLDQIQGAKLDLAKLVHSLTDAAGIPVREGQVEKVLKLVNILVSELLFTVKSIVTVLGLRPQLVSLLSSVFTLVANILTLLIGLLAGLLPGLVASLSPLLAGLGNGLLAPILTPVVALVAGLAGPPTA